MNKPLAETMDANIRAIGLPKWTEADQTLAKALQKELGVKQAGLSNEIAELEGNVKDEDNRGGGSDDIGDVSWNLPTITLRYPANIPDLPGHNWANAIAMATPIAHKGTTVGAKALAPLCSTCSCPCAGGAGVDVLPRRADEGPEVRALHHGHGPAGDHDERRGHGEVSRGDEEVLLRPRRSTRRTSSSWGSGTPTVRPEKGETK